MMDCDLRGRGRLIEQWNTGSINREADASIYENLLYSRAGIVNHEERIDFSINDAGTMDYSFVKKKKRSLT